MIARSSSQRESFQAVGAVAERLCYNIRRKGNTAEATTRLAAAVQPHSNPNILIALAERDRVGAPHGLRAAEVPGGIVRDELFTPSSMSEIQASKPRNFPDSHAGDTQLPSADDLV
jgi:hypothetical protein